ncbi:hypothetical protein ACWCPF_04005 [Streptomyces sp. NPDC001858]
MATTHHSDASNSESAEVHSTQAENGPAPFSPMYVMASPMQSGMPPAYGGVVPVLATPVPNTTTTSANRSPYAMLVLLVIVLGSMITLVMLGWEVAVALCAIAGAGFVAVQLAKHLL